MVDQEWFLHFADADDDQQLFPFRMKSMHYVKAVTIGVARYLNKTKLLGSPSRPLRWSSQLTPTTFPSSSLPSTPSKNASR